MGGAALALEVCPASIAPGSPWQNGFVETSKGKLRDARDTPVTDR
jgi:hypothetical protein